MKWALTAGRSAGWPARSSALRNFGEVLVAPDALARIASHEAALAFRLVCTRSRRANTTD